MKWIRLILVFLDINVMIFELTDLIVD